MILGKWSPNINCTYYNNAHYAARHDMKTFLSSKSSALYGTHITSQSRASPYNSIYIVYQEIGKRGTALSLERPHSNPNSYNRHRNAIDPEYGLGEGWRSTSIPI